MKEYLQMTKQDVNHLYGGIITFGLERILHEIIPEAIKQKKRIVWQHTEQDIFGRATYTLQPLEG